jgi:hypothetical protein
VSGLTDLLVRIVVMGVAGYVCITSISAPRSIIYPGCMIGRDEPYLDVYRRAPCALALSLLMAWAAAGESPALAKLTRCAALVAAVMWGLSVGLARGWW